MRIYSKTYDKNYNKFIEDVIAGTQEDGMKMKFLVDFGARHDFIDREEMKELLMDKGNDKSFTSFRCNLQECNGRLFAYWFLTNRYGIDEEDINFVDVHDKKNRHTDIFFKDKDEEWKKLDVKFRFYPHDAKDKFATKEGTYFVDERKWKTNDYILIINSDGHFSLFDTHNTNNTYITEGERYTPKCASNPNKGWDKDVHVNFNKDDAKMSCEYDGQ